MATILIVNDRAPNREFLGKLLGKEGHRQLQAADGLEAFTLTRAERPDLVIADILMPTMDGYEFVRKLRADPVIANTPVIFYTAHYHEVEARRLADACGVAAVLTKPAEPEAVLQTIQRVLMRASSPRANTTAETLDNEHLRRQNAKLSAKVDELRRANERLKAMVESGLQLGSRLDPSRLLHDFCNVVREIIGARHAVVGIYDGNDEDYQHFLTSGFDPATSSRLNASNRPGGAIRTALADGRCFRANSHTAVVTSGIPASFPPAQAMLAASIRSSSRVHGWVCLLDKLGAGGFTDEDELLVRMLATQVGRSYENGSLYTDLLQQSSALKLEIANRRRAETEARGVSAMLHAITNSTTDAVFVKDRARKYLFFNKTASWFVGKPVSEVLGRNDSELFDAESARRIAECDTRVMTNGAIETIEETLTAAGVTRTYLSTKAPYRDAEGNVIGVIGISHDITDRKRVEAQLELTARAIRAVSQGILITDPNQRDNPIVYASLGFERLTGYSAAEAVGRNCRFLQGKETDPAAVARIRHAISVGQSCVVEVLNYKKNGTPFWNEVSISPVHDESGRVTHFVGVQSDVTPRRKFEDRYHQSQKMEAIGQLAGGVAHDFNNLLTIINGYSDMILRSLPAADASRDLLNEIHKAGQRAAGLTRQLLAFSRKAIIEPKLLDLRSVVIDVDRMLRRIVGEDIELTVATDPDAGSVKADPGQIEQVILNLVVNARDAMPHGGQLTIEVRNVELDETYTRNLPGMKPGPHVLLAVADTGCGMDSITMEHIFEPFFTTKGERGTGLGLATAHGIIRQSEGHVAVYSELGRGTTFKVYLPRLTVRPSTGLSHHSTIATMPHGSETILLVEDEDAVRALSRHILAGCGYTIVEARDGVEAIRIAGSHPKRIDLLVTDVVLPRLGGREVAERIREFNPGMKILFVSGYTDDAVVRHGILEAESEFLQKPFTPSALAMKVRATLDDRPL